MLVTAKADWQRGGQGGANIAANAILAHALKNAAEMAAVLSDHAAAAEFTLANTKLVTAINVHLWDEAAGAYKDNPTSSLHPQDGNSLAVWFNVTQPASRKESILASRAQSWTSLGALSPEWLYEGKEAIGTFPGAARTAPQALLRHASSCCVVLRRVALCCVLLRRAASCCVMLRLAALCCVVLRRAAACCVMLLHAASCCVIRLSYCVVFQVSGY